MRGIKLRGCEYTLKYHTVSLTRKRAGGMCITQFEELQPAVLGSDKTSANNTHNTKNSIHNDNSIRVVLFVTAVLHHRLLLLDVDFNQ
jgi:hypothetical protein